MQSNSARGTQRRSGFVQWAAGGVSIAARSSATSRPAAAIARGQGWKSMPSRMTQVVPGFTLPSVSMSTYVLPPPHVPALNSRR